MNDIIYVSILSVHTIHGDTCACLSICMVLPGSWLYMMQFAWLVLLYILYEILVNILFHSPRHGTMLECHEMGGHFIKLSNPVCSKKIPESIDPVLHNLKNAEEVCQAWNCLDKDTPEYSLFHVGYISKFQRFRGFSVMLLSDKLTHRKRNQQRQNITLAVQQRQQNFITDTFIDWKRGLRLDNLHIYRQFYSPCRIDLLNPPYGISGPL